MNKQIEIWSEEGRRLLKEIYLKRKFEKKRKLSFGKTPLRSPCHTDFNYSKSLKLTHKPAHTGGQHTSNTAGGRGLRPGAEAELLSAESLPVSAL